MLSKQPPQDLNLQLLGQSQTRFRYAKGLKTGLFGFEPKTAVLIPLCYPFTPQTYHLNVFACIPHEGLPVGFEPTISRLTIRRVIHFATASIRSRHGSDTQSAV